MSTMLTFLLSGMILLVIFLYSITPVSIVFQCLLSAQRSCANLKLKRIKVDGLEIEYLRGGSGPALVLLHGFAANKDYWNRVSGHLVNDFDVIAIDLPGFGNSTRDIELDYDIHSQVDRLKRITDALNLTEFNLAGSSMGGYIAGNYAAQYPDTVTHLWLISPLGIRNSIASDMFAAIKKSLKPILLPQTKDDFLQLFNFLFIKPPFIPSPVINHLAIDAKKNAELNNKIFKQIIRVKNGEPNPDQPLDKVLINYSGPVLISWGDTDRVLHVSGASVLKQAIPHAKLEISQNVGHLPMVEIPMVTAKSFLSFAKQPLIAHDER